MGPIYSKCEGAGSPSPDLRYTPQAVATWRNVTRLGRRPWSISSVHLVASLCLAVACDRPATQIVVVVDSDLGADLSDLRVEVRGGRGNVDGVPSVEEVQLGSDADHRLPLSFGVVPAGGDASRRVEVKVTGVTRAGCDEAGTGCQEVERVARTGFIAGKRIRLPVYIWGNCAEFSCEEEETCSNASCIPVEVDQALLDEVSSSGGEFMGSGEVPGVPDPNDPPEHPLDAGEDAARDAGPDSSVCTDCTWQLATYFKSTAPDEQAAVEPIYEVVPGWSESTYGARSWAELPANYVKYVRHVEELIGVPIALLSTSPKREDTILVRDPFED